MMQRSLITLIISDICFENISNKLCCTFEPDSVLTSNGIFVLTNLFFLNIPNLND
jgi:hypothetical protein